MPSGRISARLKSPQRHHTGQATAVESNKLDRKSDKSEVFHYQSETSEFVILTNNKKRLGRRVWACCCLAECCITANVNQVTFNLICLQYLR